MEFPIPDFQFLETLHCVTGSMRHIYQFNHFSISEEMLLGLGAGVGFVYWHSRGQAPFLGGRANSGRPGELGLEKTTGLRTGVKINWFETSSQRKAEQALFEKLTRNEPVMLQVDMGYLPYFHFPEEYHFGGHMVVAAGLDPENLQVAIADRDGERHSVSLQDLAKARGSTFKPFPPHYRYYSFDFSSAHQPIDVDIRQSIREATGAMLHPPIANLGVRGIHTAAARVFLWPEVMTDKELRYACFNSFIFIDKTGGSGGGIFRYMFARYLAEAALITGEERLSETGSQFQEIGDQWQEVASLFKQASQDYHVTRLLKQISQQMVEIAAMEEKAWMKLDEVVMPK